ncbi:MAG TPA: Rieske (2Fe-2S) protein [Thermoplasmata archaeon]|nr:Rieske (2Fe-2S) protein [Thermoplasmata archaeon]
MAWKSSGLALASLPSGTMREVTIDGRSILVVRLGDAVHAVDGICPHAGGVLADGALERNRVKCPEHGATYDVTDGAVLVDPDGIEPPQGGTSPLTRFETRVTQGQIEIDVG